MFFSAYRQFCVSCLILTVGQSIHAQSVQYEGRYATGIHNLRVDGRCFDVDFEQGSYFDVYGRTNPYFIGQPAMADAAADEIRDVLNAEEGVPQVTKSESELVWVPSQSVGPNRFRAEQVGHSTSSDPWRRYADFEGVKDHDWPAWELAKFREGPTVVYADNTGFAVGINNLNVDGNCLDVRFAPGSFEEVYGRREPRYLGAEPWANLASTKIMNLLNAEPEVPEINKSDSEVLWIPTARSRSTFEAEQAGHNTSDAAWQRFGDFRGSTLVDYAAWDFVVFEESLDCNRDGIVDIEDMNCACGTGLGDSILTAIDSLVGDLNGDGTVSFADFLTLSGNFGDAGNYTDGDLDCDGKIGFSDFLLLSGNFSGGTPSTNSPTDLTAAVPEPQFANVAVLLIPGLLLIRRRR